MCPICDRMCDFWTLNETICLNTKFSYLFDNTATIIYAFCVPVWVRTNFKKNPTKIPNNCFEAVQDLFFDLLEMLEHATDENLARLELFKIVASEAPDQNRIRAKVKTQVAI